MRARLAPLLLVALLACAVAVETAAAAPERPKSPLRTFDGRLIKKVSYKFVGKDLRRVRVQKLSMFTGDGFRKLRYRGRLPIPTNSAVVVKGRLRGKTIHVRPGGIRYFGPYPMGATGPDGGNMTVGIAFVNFSDDAKQRFTAAEVRDLVFQGEDSPKEYLRHVSGGAVVISGKERADGDFFGSVTIPFANGAGGCRYGDYKDAARKELSKAGTKLGDYDQLILIFPSMKACHWAGLGGGGTTWLNGDAVTTSIFAHELAHNFGLPHSDLLRCTRAGVRVAAGGTCEPPDYVGGDPWSLMGQGKLFHLVGWQASKLGWLADKNIVTPTASGRYAIAPMAPIGGPGTKLLRLAYPQSGSTYDLEFRRPAGRWEPFGPGDPVTNGVTIRRAPFSYLNGGTTQLVDTTPETATYDDAPLAVGRTFSDPDAGVSVTVKSVGPAGAVVDVKFARTPDVVSPTTPGIPQTRTGYGPVVGLKWQPSTDDVGVAGYRVLRNGKPLATTTGTTFDDRSASENTWYVYEIEAFDAFGNRTRSSSKWHHVTVPPFPPEALSAKVVGGHVELSWKIGAPGTVALNWQELQRNGQYYWPLNKADSSFTDRNPPRGQVTYAIRGHDIYGHKGEFAEVTVTVP